MIKKAFPRTLFGINASLVENEKVLPLLIGGVESNWGEFPSAVLIDGPNEFCGGTIVDASHVSSPK